MKYWGLLTVLAAVIGSTILYLVPKQGFAAAPDGIAATLILTDAAGNDQLEVIRQGGQFMAVLDATSTADVMHEYVAVFKVIDSEGYTVSLSVLEGLMNPDESIRITTPVFLTEVGDYAVRSFAYSFPAIGSARDSTAISPIVTASISVTDIAYNHKTGIIVPLYAYPRLDTPGNVWSTVAQQKIEHPDVPFAVIINPLSGPGLWQDPNYLRATSGLRESGIEYVMGYVPTNYARQNVGKTLEDINAMIDTYREWYPDVNGILLDEVNSSANHLGFYNEIVSHAKAVGMEYVFANPGTRIAEEYIQIFENLTIYEHRVLPSVSQLQQNTYFPRYSPESFSFVVKNVQALDMGYLEEARHYVSFLYITSDVESVIDSNPYNTLPRYFSDLVGFLDSSMQLGQDRSPGLEKA